MYIYICQYHLFIYMSYGSPAWTAQPEQGAVEEEILKKMELALDEFSKLEVDAEVGFYSAYYKSGETTLSQRFNTVAQAMKWLLSLSHSHKSGNLQKGLGMAQKAVAMEVALSQKTTSLLKLGQKLPDMMHQKMSLGSFWQSPRKAPWTWKSLPCCSTRALCARWRRQQPRMHICALCFLANRSWTRSTCWTPTLSLVKSKVLSAMLDSESNTVRVESCRHLHIYICIYLCIHIFFVI